MAASDMGFPARSPLGELGGDWWGFIKSDAECISRLLLPLDTEFLLLLILILILVLGAPHIFAGERFDAARFLTNELWMSLISTVDSCSITMSHK